MVSSCRIDAALAQETRPCIRHQTPELVALLLVAGVVDVGSAWKFIVTKCVKNSDERSEIFNDDYFLVSFDHLKIWCHFLSQYQK